MARALSDKELFQAFCKAWASLTTKDLVAIQVDGEHGRFTGEL